MPSTKKISELTYGAPNEGDYIPFVDVAADETKRASREDLRGYQGYQGPQGPQGRNGIDGTQGPQGSQGFQGSKGSQGSQGPQGRSTQYAFVVKSSVETVNNSTVLQDDGELLFAAAANSTYHVRIFILFKSAATADFKYQINVPSGGLFRGQLQTGAGEETALETTSNNIAAAPDGTERSFFVDGALITTNAGNLQVQWAQQTAEVSDTKVYAGSFIRYMKVV